MRGRRRWWVLILVPAYGFALVMNLTWHASEVSDAGRRNGNHMTPEERRALFCRWRLTLRGWRIDGLFAIA